MVTLRARVDTATRVLQDDTEEPGSSKLVDTVEGVQKNVEVHPEKILLHTRGVAALLEIGDPNLIFVEHIARGERLEISGVLI